MELHEMQDNCERATHSFLSVSQVASVLDVKPSAVRRWISSGSMMAIRLPSGHFRVPMSEVDRVTHPVGTSASSFDGAGASVPLPEESVVA